MKNIIKILGYTLISVFLCIMLSGCTKKETVDPNKNKIVIWGFESEDAWKPVVNNLSKTAKGYKIIYQQQTLDSQYENRVLNSILSTQTPDIWAMPNDWTYRHKEKLYPMPESLAKQINLDNQFVPSVKESVYFDNKIYALATSSEPLMIYYNPKIFEETQESISTAIKDSEERKTKLRYIEEPPKLWSDFTEAAKLLTKKENGNITLSGVALGTGNIDNASDLLYLLMMQNGTNITSKDFKLATINLPQETNTGTSNSPGQRALEFYSSFANPISPNYSWNDSLGNSVDAFGNGKVAMIFGYSNLQNTLLQKYPTLKYKKAYTPQNSQETDKITDLAKFNVLGVSILSKNPALSWELVNQIVSENADDLNSATHRYTAKKASSYDTSINAREGSNPERLSLATAHSVIKGRYPGEFDAYLKQAIDNVNSKRLSAQSALDLAANNITELLRKETW